MRWLRPKGSWVWLPAVALCACAAVSASADVTYVKADATGNNDGTSWEDAFIYLQDALAVVEAGDEIWVAAGEYRPDQGESQTPGDRESSFEIPHGVSLYGGFDGTEETLEERAGLFEQTVLSGDLEGDDEPGFVNVDDNSYIVVRAAYGETGETVIDGFRITGGNSLDYAGGLMLDGPCTVRNGVFVANRARRRGGAVGAWSQFEGSADFVACRFLGNEAGQGGGVGVHLPPTLTFRACEYRGNVAGEGGAVWTDSALEYEVTIVGCEFRDNEGGHGGALLTGAPTFVRECAFGNNVAAGEGGAAWASAAVIVACTFEDNTAVRGGALHTGSASITDCLFLRNMAQLGGGLYHFGLHFLLDRCAFIENVATERDSTDVYTLGGAAYVNSRSDSWCARVRDCTFVRNTAVASEDAGSGALYCGGRCAVVTGCTFQENSTSHNGGAMSFLDASHNFHYYNCVFQRNAATCGGAVSIESGNPRFVQCIFTGNVASADGGAAYNARPFFINCAMFANTANGHGGGIFGDEYGRPKVWNTILWNNEDQDGTGESSQVFGGIPRIRFACIQGWTGQLEGIATFGDDPLFVDPLGPDGTPGTEDDDFHLSPGSPCIDRGCNWIAARDYADLDEDDLTWEEYVPFDLDEEGRFVDDPNTPDTSCGAPIIDLGPYEVGGTGQQPCRGDVDGDGDVDRDDLTCLLDRYGTEYADPGYDSVCDFDAKGQVDLKDLARLLSLYGRQCE